MRKILLATVAILALATTAYAGEPPAMSWSALYLDKPITVEECTKRTEHTFNGLNFTEIRVDGMTVSAVNPVEDAETIAVRCEIPNHMVVFVVAGKCE
jgi:hypothetical protein